MVNEAKITGALALIASAFAQVVQMRDGQRGQAFIARIAIDRAGAFEQVHDSRAADVLMGFVHLHQQADISGRVLAGKGGAVGALGALGAQ